MPTRRLLVPCLLLVSALTAMPARAGVGQYSVMMDDDNLVYRTDRTRDKALAKMEALGVDYVRVTVLWKVLAHDVDKNKATRRAFKRYGAANPKAYPRKSWNRFDNLVTAALNRKHPIGVYFNLTGPGPAYGHETAPKSEARNRETWKPIPRQYKLFVEAVGKRYSGTYKDEDTGHQTLPRVSFWSLWNEPNQGGWLTPQYVHGKPYSPYMFRKLAIAGLQGLLATGHSVGKDYILVGETAPLGSHGRTSRSQMYPTTFITNLFCVDGNGNPKSGLGCSDFDRYGPLKFSAWGHHPYTKTLGPTQKDPDPNAITMANLDKLTGLLDRISSKTGRVPANLPVALTEFGYETKPPDPIHGISLAKQAEYSNVADLVAFFNPRVVTQTQFLLRDVPPLTRYKKTDRHYWFTYQSGLFYANYKPKPSANAYAFPLVGSKIGTNPTTGLSTWSFWGQLRFRPNGVTDAILLQFKAAGTSTWQQLGDAFPTTLPQRNYFLAQRDIPGPGKVRALWFGSSPYGISGRTIDVS